MVAVTPVQSAIDPGLRGPVRLGSAAADQSPQHQRKKKFVKRYGEVYALIVVMVVAWGSCYG
jgi:hypothetical protein